MLQMAFKSFLYHGCVFFLLSFWKKHSGWIKSCQYNSYFFLVQIKLPVRNKIKILKKKESYLWKIDLWALQIYLVQNLDLVFFPSRIDPITLFLVAAWWASQRRIGAERNCKYYLFVLSLLFFGSCSNFLKCTLSFLN